MYTIHNRDDLEKFKKTARNKKVVSNNSNGQFHQMYKSSDQFDQFYHFDLYE